MATDLKTQSLSTSIRESMERVDKILNGPELKDTDPQAKKMAREVFRRIIEEGKTPGEAFEMDAENLVQLYNFGYTMYTNGDYKNAFQVFNILSILFPFDGAVLMAKGVCQQRMKAWELAVENYMAAALVDLQDPLPFFYASECFAELKQPKEAVFMLEKAIARCGDIPQLSKIKVKAELIIEKHRMDAANQKEPGVLTKALREKSKKQDVK